MASRQRSCRARRVIFLNAAAWLVPALLWAQERPAALHGVNAVTVGVSPVAPDGVVPVRLTEKSSPSTWFGVSLMVNAEVSLKTPGPVGEKV